MYISGPRIERFESAKVNGHDSVFDPDLICNRVNLSGNNIGFTSTLAELPAMKTRNQSVGKVGKDPQRLGFVGIGVGPHPRPLRKL